MTRIELPANTPVDAAAAWQRISELPIVISEPVDTRQHTLEGATQFVRTTTEIILEGEGAVGVGENVAYQSDVHAAITQHAPAIDLRGTWTFGAFAAHLDTLDLVPPGEWSDYPSFHRWAFESAALDLALTQAGTNLAELIGAAFTPLRFCVSPGLGTPPSTDIIHDWLTHTPNIEFKVDASKAWTDDIVADLAATRSVRVVDIKGHYTGEWIDNSPDPDLYARIAHGMPSDLLIEDAMLTADTRAALGPGACERLTWDAPIHNVRDLDALTDRPAAINIKPSRIDSLQELLAILTWCGDRSIPCYAGGQFELARGRTQAQALASIFYPHAANDIAPVAWHTARPGDEMPTSPLQIPASPGFGW